MKNWKTTVFGSGGLLTIAAAAISSLFDGDPKTNPDWAIVIGSIMGAIAFYKAQDAA